VKNEKHQTNEGNELAVSGGLTCLAAQWVDGPSVTNSTGL